MRGWVLSTACLAAPWVAGLGCGQLLGISDWVDVGPPADASSDGSGAESAGDDAHGDGNAPPADAGPCHAPVEGGADGVFVLGQFCIDSTEAPVALYEKFVNDPSVNPDAGQPPECAWNASYDPPYDPYAGDPLRAQKPQTAVDWCDALAYCTYWGKHLCGNRGDGGALDPNGALKDGQWYAACTNGTSQAYPYGDIYDPSACRTELPHDAGASVVPSSSRCQGGVPGLFDMSGNIQEWENSCIPSGDASADLCVLRGGVYFFAADSVTCALRTGGALNPRSTSLTDGDGVRCCWEPR